MDRGFAGFPVAVDDRHLGAFCGEPLGAGQPDPRCPAGDGGDLAGYG